MGPAALCQSQPQPQTGARNLSPDLRTGAAMQYGANRVAITGGSGYALDKCMMGNIQGPGPHHGTGHDAHSSTVGCQRWSNLAA